MMKTRWFVECVLKAGGSKYVANGDCEFVDEVSQAKLFRTEHAANREACVWYDVADISYSVVHEARA